MPQDAAFCAVLCGSVLSRAFQNEIHHSAKRSKMRQIEAAKSSRKVVKRVFLLPEFLLQRIPYAALPGQQKNRPLSQPESNSLSMSCAVREAGIPPAVRARFLSSCPEHLLVHLRLFLPAHHFFLLLPGVFQLLHPSHFFSCFFQAKVCVRIHRHAMLVCLIGNNDQSVQSPTGS